jgi:RNA polymerase sigma-70 factor (ECF subfamily)
MYHLAPLHAEFSSYAQKLTQNKVFAQDLVQEALIRYLDNDASEINNREGYIKRTIHNLYVNSLRKNKTHRIYVSRSLNTESAVLYPSSNMETVSELNQLFSLMQKVLTPQERAVFILKKSFEKEYEWIEKVFGITYENSRQLLHRAKSKLRRHANTTLYHQGGTHLYNIYLKASRTGELSPLIAILKEDIAALNN